MAKKKKKKRMEKKQSEPIMDQSMDGFTGYIAETDKEELQGPILSNGTESVYYEIPDNTFPICTKTRRKR